MKKKIILKNYFDITHQKIKKKLFTIVLSFSSFERSCLFFYFVYHLFGLQDLKYKAIYDRNINEKLNITRKQIQKQKLFFKVFLSKNILK